MNETGSREGSIQDGRYGKLGTETLGTRYLNTATNLLDSQHRTLGKRLTGIDLGYSGSNLESIHLATG